MEIGGCDIVVDFKIPVAPNLVKLIIQDHWPAMVVEIDENEDFFAYENQEAKNVWDNDFDESYDAKMIYVLFRDDFKEVSFVIDSNKKIKYIVDDIIQFIRKCEPDETNNI